MVDIKKRGLDSPLLEKPASELRDVEPVEVSDDGEWRLFNFSVPLRNSMGFVDVYYGHAKDTARPPTMVMGMSKASQPKLGQSQIYKRLWPGKKLQGCELHTSGDTIGWMDSDPLNFDSVRSTWLGKETFPNTKFRLQIHDRHVSVKHGSKTLHTFLHPMLQPHDASEVYFHLFIQDAKNVAIQQQTPVKMADQASAAQNIHGKIPSIVIFIPKDGTTSSTIMAKLRASTLFAGMMSTMLRCKKMIALVSSATEGRCKKMIAFVSSQTGAAFEQGHDGRISSLSILPDGKYIVTCGLDDGRALLWNVASGRKICDLAKKHDKTDAYAVPGVHYLPYRVWIGATVKVGLTLKQVADEPHDLEKNQQVRKCSVRCYDEEEPFEFEVAWSDLLRICTPDSRHTLQGNTELTDTEIQVHGTIARMHQETENRVLGTLDSSCPPEQRYFEVQVGSQTLRIDAGRLKETDVTMPGFNCCDAWCVQDVIRRDFVALGRTDNWIIVVDVAHRTGKGLLCTHACMVRHDEEGPKGKRTKSKVGVRVVRYNAQLNKLFTCGGGVVRMWNFVKHNQGQLEEMRKKKQSQRFRKTVHAAISQGKLKSTGRQQSEQPQSEQPQSEQQLSQLQQTGAPESCKMLQRTKTSKEYLSNEVASEWACMEDPKKPFFEVSLDEEIVGMHMLGGDIAMGGVKDDPRKVMRLAVAATGKSADRVYIIDGVGETKCTVTVPKEEEKALTAVSMTQIGQHLYLIAGTKSGNVLLIKLLDDCDMIHLSEYPNWHRLTGHAPSISIWTCTVVRYKFVAEGNLNRSVVLITTSGDNNVKLWSCDDPLDKERCKCMLTLSHHTGPVTALGWKAGIDTQGMENEISMIDAEEEQNVDIYTASWDGKCMRWVLADLLGKHVPDSAVALYSEPIQDNRMGVVSESELLSVMPQQVYKSITLFEAIASPMSWCLALIQLSMTSFSVRRAPWTEGDEQDGSLLLPLWIEYILANIFAWPYVLCLLIDYHNKVKQQIFEELEKDDAGSNWQRQKNVADLRSWLKRVSGCLWFWSQVLWMLLFRYMIIMFRQHMMIRVQCFQGWHLAVSLYNLMLMWLYVSLSIPLLVGLGDCNLVVPVPWYVRCTPLGLIWTKFRTQKKQLPKYAGLFTRCNNYYLFEACLTMSKIIIPSVIMLTYRQELRDGMIQAMGIALVFFACHTPPVQARIPAGGIMFLSFVPFLIPSLKLYPWP